MKKKILILIGIVLIVVATIFIVLKVIPVKTKIEEEKIVQDVKFYNARITKDNKKYIFYVTLTTDKEINADNFDATILDKQGKEIITLKGFIGNMKKGDIINVEIETPTNLDRAYEISYKVNTE